MASCCSFQHCEQTGQLRRLSVSVAVVLLSAMGLSACASNEKQAALEQSRQQDKQQLIHEIDTLKAARLGSDQMLEQQSNTLTEISNRLAKLEEADVVQQAQLKALSNRIEQLHAHKKTASVKRPARVKTAVEKSAPVAEKKRQTAVVNRPKPVVPQPAPAKVDSPASVEVEKNAYTAAYLALKSGRYEEAANGFNQQLDRFPNGEYADQAWYWLGEARFAQNDSDRAFNAFKYVADHFSDSVKHAAALLKLGQISETRSHYQESANFYKRLIADHPDSSLAEQARESLGRTGSDASRPGN